MLGMLKTRYVGSTSQCMYNRGLIMCFNISFACKRKFYTACQDGNIVGLLTTVLWDGMSIVYSDCFMVVLNRNVTFLARLQL